MHILYVEDHEDTRIVFRRLLTLWGHRVTAVGGVTDALAYLEEERFDLLLSDIGLPDGEGTKIMEYCRARCGLRGIALTAYATRNDIARFLEAGFDEVLIKPASLPAIREAIERVASHPPFVSNVYHAEGARIAM